MNSLFSSFSFLLSTIFTFFKTTKQLLYRGGGWRCLLFSFFFGWSGLVGLVLGGIESEMIGLYPFHLLEEIIATALGIF